MILKIILLTAVFIILPIVVLVLLVINYYRRKKNYEFYERMLKALGELQDEMNRYGVETLDELEAAKEREHMAEIFPEMSDGQGIHKRKLNIFSKPLDNM